MEQEGEEYNRKEVVARVDLLAVVGLYVGGVIGAGFASGQELVVFFVRYGKGGVAGILFAAALLTSGMVQILNFCFEEAITSYHGLFSAVGFRKSAPFEWAYSFILLVGCSVMFAGCAALGDGGGRAELFRLLTGLLLLLVLISGRRGILAVGRWLAPIISILLILLAAVRLRQGPPPAPPMDGSIFRGLEAALLYSSYNLGFSMAVLAGTARLLTTAKQRWTAAVIANGVLGAAIFLLFFALRTLNPQDLAQALPLQALAAGRGPIILLGYRFTLWASMYTTALANSFALTGRLEETGKLSWPKAALAVIVLSVSCSYVGFAVLIRIAYPLLGLAVLWFLSNLAWRRARFSRT